MDVSCIDSVTMVTYCTIIHSCYAKKDAIYVKFSIDIY